MSLAARLAKLERRSAPQRVLRAICQRPGETTVDACQRHGVEPATPGLVFRQNYSSDRVCVCGPRQLPAPGGTDDTFELMPWHQRHYMDRR